MTMVCPVCKRGNGVWIGCYNAACTDGRNLIPVSPAVADLADARAEIERLKQTVEDQKQAVRQEKEEVARLTKEIERLKGREKIHHKMIEKTASDVEKYKSRAEKAEADLAVATDTIELLNSNNLTLAAELAGWKQAARQMEAERDEARAQVAAAFEAAAQEVGWWAGPRDIRMKTIRALTPADAQFALEAYGREKMREGMRHMLNRLRHEGNVNPALTYTDAIEWAKSVLAAMEKEGGE